MSIKNSRANDRLRPYDILITNKTLYQLSYVGNSSFPLMHHPMHPSGSVPMDHLSADPAQIRMLRVRSRSLRIRHSVPSTFHDTLIYLYVHRVTPI